jgi:large subunit ribosomal protein L3
VNKLILKVGESGQEVSPKGGFLHYGEVRNPFVLVHGSVPGPTKRLVRMRDPVRRQQADLKEAPEMVYISTESKQGA